jgi:hypothetical protein
MAIDIKMQIFVQMANVHNLNCFFFLFQTPCHRSDAINQKLIKKAIKWTPEKIPGKSHNMLLFRHQSVMDTNQKWKPIGNGHQSAMEINQQWTPISNGPHQSHSQL